MDKKTGHELWVIVNSKGPEGEVVSVGYTQCSAINGAEEVMNLTWLEMVEMGYVLVKERWSRLGRLHERGKPVMGSITCPLRVRQAGPWEHKPDLDHWEWRGFAKLCSFCGSIHPEDLMEFCGQVDGLDNYIVRKGSSGPITKLYIHKKGIRNASDGPIKFYTCHLDHLMEKPRQELIREVTKAIITTRSKDKERMDRFKKGLRR